ncbi:MAG: YesL family protein [Lachnospiraceae bacterium]|nr:YesL family protein [Lachnospiraceae bacterium]
MGKFFSLDSPVMSFLNKVADLMILNLLYFFCSLPIITIGATTTALYYVTLKMVRNEESYIVKGFFKSFKQNFKQATVMWIIDLIILGIFMADFAVITGKVGGVEFPSTTFSTIMKVLLLSAAILILFTFTFSFPVLSKFDNTIKNTYKNSFIMSIRHFPTTIVTIILWGVCLFLLAVMPQLLIFAVILLFSVIAYITSMLFVKNFDKYISTEDMENTTGIDDMDWHVNKENEENSQESDTVKSES